MRLRAVLYALRAIKTVQYCIRQSRDVLYRDTPSRMPHDGVIWILAAMVWYSAVLYGGWLDNYKFGSKQKTIQDRGKADSMQGWPLPEKAKADRPGQLLWRVTAIDSTS